MSEYTTSPESASILSNMSSTTTPLKIRRGRRLSDVKPPTDSRLHQLALRAYRHDHDGDASLDASDDVTHASSSSSSDSDASSPLSRFSSRSQSAPPTARSPPTTAMTSPAVSLNSPKMEIGPVQEESMLNRRFINAQKRFPGKACVFVGNLPASHFTDNELNAVVETEFSRFGECFVRVERVTRDDGVKMPHALVQFTNNSDAKLALKHGNKINVQGRQFRTEPSRAKRSVLIGHRDGSFILPEEACAMLSRFGEIESAVILLTTTNAGTTPFYYAKVTFVAYGAYVKARKVIASYWDPAYTYLV